MAVPVVCLRLVFGWRWVDLLRRLFLVVVGEIVSCSLGLSEGSTDGVDSLSGRAVGVDSPSVVAVGVDSPSAAP